MGCSKCKSGGHPPDLLSTLLYFTNLGLLFDGIAFRQNSRRFPLSLHPFSLAQFHCNSALSFFTLPIEQDYTEETSKVMSQTQAATTFKCSQCQTFLERELELAATLFFPHFQRYPSIFLSFLSTLTLTRVAGAPLRREEFALSVLSRLGRCPRIPILCPWGSQPLLPTVVVPGWSFSTSTRTVCREPSP